MKTTILPRDTIYFTFNNPGTYRFQIIEVNKQASGKKINKEKSLKKEGSKKGKGKQNILTGFVIVQG
jgi:P pilus assembly chaperone PapD